MGIARDGWPGTELEAVSNPTGAGKPVNDATFYFSAAGYPFFIPNRRKFNIGARLAGLEFYRQICSDDVTTGWRALSGSPANMPTAPTSMFVVKDDVPRMIVEPGFMMSGEHVSITNGMQWLNPNAALDTTGFSHVRGVPGSNTVYWFNPVSSARLDIYKCTDVTQAEAAVWTLMGSLIPAANFSGTYKPIISSGRIILGVYSTYAGGFNTDIYISDDDGASWSSAYHENSGAGDTRTVYNFNDLGGGNLELWVRTISTSTLRVLTSADNGSTWGIAAKGAGITLAAPPFIMRSAAGSLFKPLSNKLYRSTDGGLTFGIVYTGSAYNSVPCESGGILYAAAQNAAKHILALASTDDGATWTEYDTGFIGAVAAPPELWLGS